MCCLALSSHQATEWLTWQKGEVDKNVSPDIHIITIFGSSCIFIPLACAFIKLLHQLSHQCAYMWWQHVGPASPCRWNLHALLPESRPGASGMERWQLSGISSDFLRFCHSLFFWCRAQAILRDFRETCHCTWSVFQTVYCLSRR